MSEDEACSSEILFSMAKEDIQDPETNLLEYPQSQTQKNSQEEVLISLPSSALLKIKSELQKKSEKIKSLNKELEDVQKKNIQLLEQIEEEKNISLKLQKSLENVRQEAGDMVSAVKLRASDDKKYLQNQYDKMRVEYEQFKKKAASVNTASVFITSCSLFYGILTSIITICQNKVFQKDFVSFMQAVYAYGRKLVYTILSWAVLVSKISGRISDPKLAMVVHYGIIVLLAGVIYVTLAVVLIKVFVKYYRYFRKKQFDKITALVVLTILGVIIFLSHPIHQHLSINQMLMIVILILAYSLIRWIIQLRKGG